MNTNHGTIAQQIAKMVNRPTTIISDGTIVTEINRAIEVAGGTPVKSGNIADAIRTLDLYADLEHEETT